MTTLDLTRQGLVRAISAAVARSAPVDAALRTRAEEIAGAAARDDAGARVVRRGFGRYAVERHPPLAGETAASFEAER